MHYLTTLLVESCAVLYNELVRNEETTRLTYPGVSPPAMIYGERVTLRHSSLGFSDDEIVRRYQWSLDEDLQYWSGSIPTASSLSIFRHDILRGQHVREARRDHFGILDEHGILIGIISYYNIVPERGQAELGIYIGERNCWNKGYGTAAVTMLLDYLFRYTTLQVMYLSTYANNQRAQACYRKVGFEVTGTMRKYSARAGYYTDVQMKVTRAAYLSRYPIPRAKLSIQTVAR